MDIEMNPPPSESTESTKRKSYSLDFKASVIKEIEGGKKIADVGRVFSLAHSTVCSIWKDREKLMRAYNRNVTSMKRVRTPGREDIDRALFDWYQSVKSQNITIANYNLMAKADEIAESLGGEVFKCTLGWLSRFKRRHNISFKKVSGQAAKEKSEATSVNQDVSANLELELTSADSICDQEMTIKEEPMSESEESGTSGYQEVYHGIAPTDSVARPGVSATVTPSVVSVTSLAKPSSSGEILGMPIGDGGGLLGPPPSQNVSEDKSDDTNGVLEKKPILLSSLNEAAGEAETKVLPDYRTRDQFDVYGEYIASKLRRLDWRTCAHVQKAFGDIIFQAEMGKFTVPEV